jgi:hypothetical protein
VAPENYFRSLLIGYFEGIDSERGNGGVWPVRGRMRGLEGQISEFRFTCLTGFLGSPVSWATSDFTHCSEEF